MPTVVLTGPLARQLAGYQCVTLTRRRPQVRRISFDPMLGIAAIVLLLALACQSYTEFEPTNPPRSWGVNVGMRALSDEEMNCGRVVAVGNPGVYGRGVE